MIVCMRTIYLRMPEGTYEDLRSLADKELRGTKEQALLLIIEGLRRHSAEGSSDSHQRAVGR